MVYRYLFKHFSASFLSIFITLFLISSIIILFQITKFTSYIELSLYDLFKLYSLMGIKLILFTFPISFLLACGISCLNLSKENELIMLFSLGYSPKIISKFFCYLSFIVSFILLLITLIFIPISFSLYDNFLDYKKAFSKINLKTHGYGQKIGNLIYLTNSEENGIYKDITIYKAKSKEEDEQIIFAKSAKIIAQDNSISLKLNDVTQYIFQNTLYINKIANLDFNTQVSKQNTDIQNVLEYWKDYKNPSKSKELIIYSILSLLPLCAFKYVLSFSIISSRYEKSFLYPALFIFFMLYFSLALVLSKFHIYTIISIFLIFSTLSYFFFKNKIISKY